MKLENKAHYMDTQPGKVIDGFLRSKENKPCAVCGKLTPFVEICTEARMCSDECMATFYDDLKAHGVG